MPLKFWWHSFSIIVYIFSHLPTHIVVNLSPLETLFKQQPNYTFIKIFSYSCYPFLILIISVNYLSILTNMFFLATNLLIKPTNALILLAVFTFKKCWNGFSLFYDFSHNSNKPTFFYPLHPLLLFHLLFLFPLLI